MSTLEMTPGPWHLSYVKTPEGIEDCDFNLSGSNFVQVCKCVCPYGSQDERKANAQAISAVPDLIEALQGLFEHCAMVHKHWGENSNRAEADEAIAKAHAALAKAGATS